MTEERVNYLITKHLSRIESAGNSAYAMGWVVPILGVGVAYLLDYSVNLYFLSTIILLIGLYFIKTGKYIKNFSGRWVRTFLLLNGFASLVFVQGIIPLVVSIYSFMGFYSVGKVDKLDDISVDSYPSKLTNKERGIFLIITVCCILIAYLHTTK